MGEQQIKQQQMPATEQEWTVKHGNMIYQGDEYVGLIPDEESRNRMVGMHNAALAQLKKQDEVHWKTRRTLLKQLAAEERRANDSIEENVRLMNRLAAEREQAKLGWERNGEAQLRINELLTELDTERGKIKSLVDVLAMLEYDDAGCPLAWPDKQCRDDALAKVNEEK